MEEPFVTLSSPPVMPVIVSTSVSAEPWNLEGASRASAPAFESAGAGYSGVWSSRALG